MTITLIIARHGNTFESDETPTRVGKNTDLKLTHKGYEQAHHLGEMLSQQWLIPDVVFTSTLLRTQETAHSICNAMDMQHDIIMLDIFDEIDYGPDENQPEDAVIARIGQNAIDAWDDHAIVPDGWLVDPDKLIQNWQNFAADLIKNNVEGDLTVLVVTSNGIARFAPHLTGDFEAFREKYPLKLRTGAYGILKYEHNAWHVEAWDKRP